EKERTRDPIPLDSSVKCSLPNGNKAEQHFPAPLASQAKADRPAVITPLDSGLRCRATHQSPPVRTPVLPAACVEIRLPGLSDANCAALTDLQSEWIP